MCHPLCQCWDPQYGGGAGGQGGPWPPFKIFFGARYEVRSISSFRSLIKRNQSNIFTEENYIYFAHPFPILQTHRQVHSISATCAAVLQFQVELLRCPGVVLAPLLCSRSHLQCQIESPAAFSSAEGREWREIRRIGWMLKHLPVPGIQHVKQGSRDVHRRIVMQEDDSVLQQLSTLPSNGRSQLLTDDPLVVRPVNSRAWRYRSVE